MKRKCTWDAILPEFGKCVYANGYAVWLLKYKKDGVKRCERIGAAAPQPNRSTRVLTEQEARECASRTLARLKRLERKPNEIELANMTVAELCDLFITRYAKPHKKSWKEDERRCKLYLIPLWGARYIGSIRRSDMADLHASIGAKHPFTANRLREQVSTMFNLAKTWELLPEEFPNPGKRVRDFKEVSRDRYLKHEELPRLLSALEEEGSVFVRGAILLLLLTGLRKSELLQLRWYDIDFQNKELRIPAERTKAARTHYLPLSTVALAVLNHIPKRSEFVIASEVTTGPRNTIQKAWHRVRAAADLDDLRLHDLRRTVGSWLAQSGHSLALIGQVLNQSNERVTQVYARFAKANVKDALEIHSTKLLDALAILPPTSDPATDIVENLPSDPLPQPQIEHDKPVSRKLRNRCKTKEPTGKNAPILLTAAEQVLVEAKVLTCLREGKGTKKAFYRKIGGTSIKVNCRELDRVLIGLMERDLIEQFPDGHYFRFRLKKESYNEICT